MHASPHPNDAFNDCPDRRGTGSEKWDRWAGRDILPLWVADMDFRAPEVVLDALRARVDHGVYGYTADTPGFAPALVAHLESLHGWSPDPGWVVGTPGVVTGLAITARLLAAPDDEILTFTPVYPPFLNLPVLAGRRTVRVPLTQSAESWSIDWDALEASITPRSKLFWLCHPHNPTGTVFGRDELLQLADLAERHGLTVISDEIWSDLLLDGLRHVPFASLDHPAARRAITLTAPSEAAWRHGDAWRRQLLGVLERHRDMVLETVRSTPGLTAARPEASYLVWIDCRGAGVADPQAACEAAGLGPSDGRDFGFPGFIRLNTACPTARLEEALRRLRKAFQSHAVPGETFESTRRSTPVS